MGLREAGFSLPLPGSFVQPQMSQVCGDICPSSCSELWLATHMPSGSAPTHGPTMRTEVPSGKQVQRHAHKKITHTHTHTQA